MVSISLRKKKKKHESWSQGNMKCYLCTSTGSSCESGSLSVLARAGVWVWVCECDCECVSVSVAAEGSSLEVGLAPWWWGTPSLLSFVVPAAGAGMQRCSYLSPASHMSPPATAEHLPARPPGRLLDCLTPSTDGVVARTSQLWVHLSGQRCKADSIIICTPW